MSSEAARTYQGQNNWRQLHLDGASFKADKGENHNPARSFWRDDTTANFRSWVRGQLPSMSWLCQILHRKHMASCCPSAPESITQKDLPLSGTTHFKTLSPQRYYQYQRGEGWSRLLLCAEKSCGKVCRLSNFCCPCSIKEISRADIHGYSYFHKVLQILLLSWACADL